MRSTLVYSGLRYWGFVLFGLLAPLCSIAQQAPANRVTISGTVRDSSSGEDLIGATVAVVEAQSGAITNAYGFFSVSVPAGNYTLRITMEGYRVLTQPVNAQQDVVLKIELPVFTTEEVNVEATSDVIAETNMGRQSVSMETVRSLPMLFGETDIIRAIQLLPGVQASSDGGSGFNVRGGAIDQNLVLLDEATVFNASHLLGFFSVFNSDAVKGAELYKSGIPARYGGRLASVLDVRMNEGNMKKKIGLTGGIGTISSRLTATGAIRRDRGAFIVSGRRTYADLFLRLSPNEQVNQNSLYFYDGNLKANYILNDNNRVFLSGYIGRDVFGFDRLFRFTWGNRTLTARWNHIFNQKLFMNLSAIYSDFDYRIGFSFTDQSGAEIISGLRNGGLKLDFNYYPAQGHAITFGGQSTYMRINPGSVRPTGESSFVNSSDQILKYALETALYGDHDWQISRRVSVRYGVRLSHFANMGPTNEYRYNDPARPTEPTDTVRYDDFETAKSFFNVEPRLGLNFRLDNRNAIKLGGERTVQYLNQLVNSASSLPTDLWYPSGTFVEPLVGWQVSGGYFRTLGSNSGWELSGEVYYKWLQNTIDYRDFARLQFNDKLELELRTGEGYAYGAEFMIKKTVGSFTGWATYTYARVFRTIPGVNKGQEYNPFNDRPHFATFVGTWNINRRWNLGGTFILASNNRITMPTGSYLMNGIATPLYAERNNYQMPLYHRADVSATYHLGIKKPDRRFKSSFNFSIYNLYSRQNAWAVQISVEEDDPTKLKGTLIYLFPIIPSVTWNFEW